MFIDFPILSQYKPYVLPCQGNGPLGALWARDGLCLAQNWFKNGAVRWSQRSTARFLRESWRCLLIPCHDSIWFHDSHGWDFLLSLKEILIDPGSNQDWFNRIWGIANPGCKTSKNMFNMFHLGYTQTSLCLVGRQLFLCKINEKSRRHPTFYLLTSRISAASSHISNPLCAKQRLYNASQLMCASPERIGKPGNARKT